MYSGYKEPSEMVKDSKLDLNSTNRLEVTLGEMDLDGNCLTCYGGNLASVSGGIPGEKVIAELVRIRGSHHHLRVIDVLSASIHRVNPPCPYYWPCTGCQWQHISYSYQLILKQQNVQSALEQYSRLCKTMVSSTWPSVTEFGYRNHARFTIGPRGALGFVNRITRKFVEVRECLLMDPWINTAMEELRGHCNETSQLSIRYGVNTGEWLIQPRLVDPNVTLSSGQTNYRESVENRTFQVGSPSFFQVNTHQIKKMVGILRAGLQLQGDELLIDAYAGVGTFAALLASSVGRVIAIEESSSAIKDASNNVSDLDNLELKRGRVEQVLLNLDQIPDVVILDPPRSGCDPSVLESLDKLSPAKIAYVSCDASTMSRDLDQLINFGYSVQSIQPIDLFPHTHHVECIAFLFRGI
ncbi:class I SAM-dependent RNA methyltransferase [SAR202 cluster bacterium AD-802-E10_MRT_200m]|nr:class I SAM-dependent RNA methyltransferase [SAR202 cluster bacterium AD-802-E10_MRT_200m]